MLQADEGDAAFEKALIKTRAIRAHGSAATKGATLSTEAQEALSGLAAAREPTQLAASNLDQLEVIALSKEGVGLAALRAARATVGEKIGAQDAAMNELAQ